MSSGGWFYARFMLDVACQNQNTPVHQVAMSTSKVFSDFHVSVSIVVIVAIKYYDLTCTKLEDPAEQYAGQDFSCRLDNRMKDFLGNNWFKCHIHFSQRPPLAR